MYAREATTEMSSFRDVPKTGVIYVMAAAAEKGFYYGNDEWSNLGQGAPETGDIPDAPERITNIPLALSATEYGPVGGTPELRQAVADLYNHRFRKGKQSQYGPENVAISAGGRIGLTRIAAALGSCNLGHFLPDYTAYEELLDIFRDFVPIPVLLRAEDGFRFTADLFREQVVGMGLGAVLLSNPCNPSGQILFGDDLAEWVDAARDLQTALVLDEFYAHYLYDEAAQRVASSACEFVGDVNVDPVIIVDGLTKNWRYPGLRLAWTIGPKEIIDRVISAGSFLDGGAPHAIQTAALPLVRCDHADQEARAIQKHFSEKRTIVLERIQSMGFKVASIPKGSFYIFASLADLPEPLQHSMHFFDEALKRRVICVPGIFFDVNPGKRRAHIDSRLRSFVRLSYGPPMDEVMRGLDRLEAMIKSYC